MPTYDYPRPAVTVDVILLGGHQGEQHVLLIQRAHAPYQDCWAFPGGFVDENEDPDHAAPRELEEETGICDLSLEKFSFYGRPGRDPRGHTVSLIYTASVQVSEVQATAADDAKAVKWFPINDLPALAFDHGGILKDYLSIL